MKPTIIGLFRERVGIIQPAFYSHPIGFSLLKVDHCLMVVEYNKLVNPLVHYVYSVK